VTGNGEQAGTRASFNGATGVSDMAEGWDHDLGGVFSGRGLRETAEIQGGSLVTSDSDLTIQFAVGRIRRGGRFNECQSLPDVTL
jgi:hypothetical protein